MHCDSVGSGKGQGKKMDSHPPVKRTSSNSSSSKLLVKDTQVSFKNGETEINTQTRGNFGARERTRLARGRFHACAV